MFARVPIIAPLLALTMPRAGFPAPGRPYHVARHVVVSTGTTDPDVSVACPQVSPDGRYLLYLRRGQPGAKRADRWPDLWIARPDGRRARLLAKGVQSAKWSPYAKRIALMRPASRGPRGSDLWTVRPDGSDCRPRAIGLTDRPDYEWSPAGQAIAYTTYDPGVRRHSLWAMEPDGAHRRQIVAATFRMRFSWADGRRLCVWQERGDDEDWSAADTWRYSLLVDRGTGTAERIRPPVPGIWPGHVMLSPGGKHLSLVSYGRPVALRSPKGVRLPLVSVWVRPRAMGRWRRLVQRPAGRGTVVWSRAGDRLAAVFHGWSDCGCSTPMELGLWWASGSLLCPVREGGSPYWSPDGRRLVYFTDTGEGRGSAMLSDANGGRQTKLGPALNHCSWMPDASALLLNLSDSRGWRIELLRIR